MYNCMNILHKILLPVQMVKDRRPGDTYVHLVQRLPLMCNLAAYQTLTINNF